MLNSIDKLVDAKKKAAFDNLGIFLSQNGFEDLPPHARLLSAGSIYGFMFDYNKNIGILYDSRKVVIALNSVFLLGRNTPFNYSRWEIIENYSYDSKEKLLELLEELLFEKIEKELW